MQTAMATAPSSGIPAGARRETDDMQPQEWQGLIDGLQKFFAEEKEEPEHASDDEPTAAGVLFVTPTGEALFLKRGPDGDHPGEYCLPGGGIEDGETASDAAIRESVEETGRSPDGAPAQLDRRSTGGVNFVTFVEPVEQKFEPKLDGEHVGFEWRRLDDPPQPLHPGVAATLAGDAALTEQQTAEGKLSDRQKAAAGSVGSKKRAEMPESVFLEPASRKYPVKEKSIGGWKFNRKLLLAAARRARMNGNQALAARADKIRDREFGGPAPATDSALKLTLALDKDSVRDIDKDGRMHVETANICKACVSPYVGHEIPRWEELGLDPSKVYKMLRHPDEIEKAASTANGIQLLQKHVPVDADDHKPYDTIGTVGSKAKWEHPFLKNSLHVWTKPGIDDIESERKRELSPGYHYDADMTPGRYEGDDYDGVMRNIVFNHVALVKDGRQGKDVVVGDDSEALQWLMLERAFAEMAA